MGNPLAVKGLMAVTFDVGHQDFFGQTVVRLGKRVIRVKLSNGNSTEWSPIRSVIIRVIIKSDDRAAGVRFVYHEYDYRPN